MSRPNRRSVGTLARNKQMPPRLHKRTASSLLITTALLSVAASAQNAPTTPNIKMVDENFVQMPSDFITVNVEQFSIGADKGKLTQSIANWSGDMTAPSLTIASGFYPGHP